MGTKTSNQVLWSNISALMIQRYGGENLGRVAKDAGVGPATMTRIKAQETSIGTDHLDKIASAFKVETWQLIAPGFFNEDKGLNQAAEAAQAAINTLAPDVRMLKRALEHMPPEIREKAANAALAVLFQHLPLEVSPSIPAQATDATQDSISG